MSTAILGRFDDSTDLELEVETLVGSHLCIQANSGAGKSGAIRKLLETTHGSLQQIVIDVEDEFYTLRERYEYLIAGGDNGDCAANVNNATALAMTILQAGVSAIVQINSLPQDEREEFIALFLDALTTAPKSLWRPLLLVLDEAQFYAPQVGNAASSQAVINFMMLGRKRGFTGVLATPRAADLDKRATAPVNNWLVGRCGQPTDRRAAAAAVGFADRSPEALALRALPARMFWAFGPALSLEPRMVKIGQTETTIIKAGQATVPPPPAPAAMRKILEGLNAAAKAAEAAPDIGKPNGVLRVAPDPALTDAAAAEARGWARGFAEAADQHLQHRRTLREALIKDLTAAVDDNLDLIDPIPSLLPAQDRRERGVVAADQIVAATRPSPAARPPSGNDGSLRGAALPLLTAFARKQPTSWEHAAVLAGIIPGNGYYYKGKKEMIDSGLVDGDCKITAAGVKLCADAPPMRLREIVSVWSNKLRSPGDQVLQHLAKTPAQWISTEDLSAALKVKPGNGYWYKGIKVARDANLIEQERGQFRLSEYLRSAPR